jgi:hypothetical protein
MLDSGYVSQGLEFSVGALTKALMKAVEEKGVDDDVWPKKGEEAG